MTAPDDLDPDLRKLLDEQLGAQAAADDDALLSRVRSRVLAAIQSPACPHRPQNTTVRASEGAWELIAPGVRRKLLWTDGEAMSSMVRLEPGALVPGHVHPIDEECVVLEGCLLIEPGIVLHSGDFHVGHKGSAHASASSDVGALLYVRGALAAA